MTDEDIYDQISDYAASEARRSLDYVMERVGQHCQSPIERMLLAALVAELQTSPVCIFCQPEFFEFFCEKLAWSTVVAPQIPIDQYFVDFAVSVPGSAAKRKLFAVECDGHEFHERTADQASRDRSRDRELQAMDVRVFRFTGREIWRKPLDCAGEILAAINDAYGEKHETRGGSTKP